MINAVNLDLQKSQYNKTMPVSPLGLQVLRALTPDDWSVQIFDENLKTFDNYGDVKLVGISATTPNINRGYEIATRFRKETNAKIVFGGVHATARPLEALQFCDSVVMGEADALWSTVLDDIEKGCLKETYKKECKPEDIPIINHSIYKHYFPVAMETSRGCPFKCKYCLSTRHFGNGFKMRAVDDVIKEMKTIRSKFVFIVDDNFFGFTEEHFDQRKALFRAMIENKINKLWGTQASVNLVERDDLLELAYKAGLRQLYVGFESLNKKVLKSINKGANLKFLKDSDSDYNVVLQKYKTAIEKIHAHGIAVIGGSMYGMDDDDPESLLLLSKFFSESRLDSMDFGLLTPLPGTPLFDQVEKEGRLIYDNFPTAWDYWLQDRLTIVPKNLGIKEFYEKYLVHLKKLETIYKKKKGFFHTLKNTGNIFLGYGFYLMKKNYIKHARNHQKAILNELNRINMTKNKINQIEVLTK